MPHPVDHELRHVLANEIHTRPPARLRAPESVTHLALLVEDADRGLELQALQALGERLGVPVARPMSNHLFVDLGAFRLKWERHTEITEYTFFRRAADGGRPLEAIPPEWLSRLPGKTLVAAHLEFVPGPGGEPDLDEVRRRVGAQPLVGSAVAGGAACAFTDFRIHADGFSRFIVIDRSLREEQAGRLVQRLLEIETYRMGALLAFPLARSLAGRLREGEERLARLTGELRPSRQPAPPDAEAHLFGSLTALAAEIEQAVAATSFRFSASRAYYELVRRRIAELRETRLQGLQTVSEFMERRLAPALATCEAVMRRQEELSARVARASELLRTRVDVVREEQNQTLLASMNQRAKLQLRLQQMVEGLSVAAITYYGAGLIGYLAKAAQGAGLPLNSDLAVAASIPIIAVAVWLALRRLRREIARTADVEHLDR
ncbi:MAG: DUF3422 family protein [Burkholderiales bacterium]